MKFDHDGQHADIPGMAVLSRHALERARPYLRAASGRLVFWAALLLAWIAGRMLLAGGSGMDEAARLGAIGFIACALVVVQSQVMRLRVAAWLLAVVHAGIGLLAWTTQ